ncbi:MAG: fumarate hydratase, partial [Clostridia bacterium]|nr:fumarate hydratase [Clostridia bacterium]
IVDAVCELTKACARITPSCSCAMKAAYDKESSENAKFALEMLIENAKIAEERQLPVCQDTGMSVVFIKLGQDVHITGGLLDDAVNEGVRRGYLLNGYRASVLDPITRVNTRDNTPAVTHISLVAGDRLEIAFLPKGFGSENMSRLYMLTPSDGIDGVKKSILDAVKLAGTKPCPPMVVGVGIGGTADKAMVLAKEQLLREIGAPSEDSTLAELERELLKDINALGIGAQGFGGETTALAIHIGKFPTHIAALPVAVNIQCNAVRLSRVTL